MRFAHRALLSALALMMMLVAVSAQQPRFTDDPRNVSPSVGTGGPVGGPTGLFTVYDGKTLQRGEFTLSIAYSNYDRDPGNVDLTIVPASFQVGLNSHVELFYTHELYRGIKVNSPANLSSFYLPNSQLRFGNTFGSGGAILLGGNNLASLSGTAVFRPLFCPNCDAANGGRQVNGQPFVQFPFVGSAGPTFGLSAGPGGAIFGFPGFTNTLGAPVASPNSGNFGPADRFPGIGSPVGGILPGIVLATSVIPATPTSAAIVVPATYTVAPSYLPDAPFINRTYGQSAFGQGVVGAKIRLTSPNNFLGVGFIPFYRFSLDRTDSADPSGFNQLQRGASAGQDVGDFGVIGFVDGRLSRSVNVSANLGYILNSNPKGTFGGTEFTLLDRPDEVIAGIGFDFPVSQYFQPILEVRSTQYVGGRTPNAFENNPIDGIAGVKIYPRRWFGFGIAYRVNFNQQDQDSFERQNATAPATVIRGGSSFTVNATANGLPRGFVTSTDPHGYIGQFWIGRRNARISPVPPNQPPVITALNQSSDRVLVARTCPAGTVAGADCATDARIRLSVDASDPNGDTLLYRYVVTGGRIEGEGKEVTWDLTGVQPGTYRVSAYADDGNQHEVCAFGTVTVAECDNCVSPPAQPCVTVSASASPTEIEQGQSVTVTANLSDNVAGATYNWSVSCGTITSGQGTSTITVDTNGCANQTVTASVEVGGLPPECNARASASYSVVGPRDFIKFDEYTNLQFNDEKARLDAYAIQLQQNTGAQAYIIAYGSCDGEAARRAGRSRDYLVNNRGIDAGRIVILDGGCRAELTIQLYVVPQGAVAPTVDSGQSVPCGRCRNTAPRRRRR